MGEYGEHQENGLTKLKEQRLERLAMGGKVKEKLMDLAEHGVAPIDPDEFAEGVAGQLAIANDKNESSRNRSMALGIVERVARLNVAVLLKAADKVTPDQIEHVHHVAELQEALKTAREDEQYVAMERERALTNGSVPGLNGHNGKPGPMANGSAPRFG